MANEGASAQGKTRAYATMELGDGYYVKFRDKSNGVGGYYPSEMTLYKGDEELVRELTTRNGWIIDFPGVYPGKWQEELGECEPMPYTQFVAMVWHFRDGFACFEWMVQPDGRYYADEDGFGAERDEEVTLYALLDENGAFVTKFAEERPRFENYRAFFEKYRRNGPDRLEGTD